MGLRERDASYCSSDSHGVASLCGGVLRRLATAVAMAGDGLCDGKYFGRLSCSGCKVLGNLSQAGVGKLPWVEDDQVCIAPGDGVCHRRGI